MKPGRGESVCVIIPAFGAETTIARAIKSALAQDHVQEVVVCDDGSKDDTAKVAALQDDGTGRLSVVKLNENKGPAAARNIGIGASRAPCVCLLDSDDFFLPGRIARLLDAEVGDWDFLADDIIIASESIAPEQLTLPSLESPQGSLLVELAPFAMANITQPGKPRREWGFVKPLMKRAFLEKHGLGYDESLRLGEDYALYVQALMAGARFRLVSACGYVAVERHASLSSRHLAGDLRKIIDFDTRCLTGQSTLNKDERDALAAHRRSVQHRHDYRVLLDTKKERGALAALAASLRVTPSWAYILLETVRAKASRFSSRLPWSRPDSPSVRFLIGAPVTRIEMS